MKMRRAETSNCERTANNGGSKTAAADRGGGLLQLTLVTAHPRLAETLLEACGARAVTLSDAGDQPLLEPPPGATPLWAISRLTALFDADTQPEIVVGRLRATLPEGDRLAVRRARVADDDWIDAWRAHAQPLRFGARLWVLPDDDVPAPRRGTAVRLPPGLAFGAGTHPSTALCLAWLARARLTGTTVLDYGCGSGILAIAALKLGAHAAVAVDRDPQALTAAADNARRNGVAARLAICTPHGLRRRRRRYDVILANILARPLIELAPRLIAQLAPGGWLVLAGLLEQQGDAVRAAYAPPLRFARAARRDGWLRLAGRG
ncbi:MAG: 50S ribosomal protein L11 methyltransferase [Gammaproteobacteria bacterium]|nr:50S ribosomal protein L11 methyltransferase [Gammaproteobacteria bacterium]